MATTRAGFAVVDIDGVVADVRHRLHHLQRSDGRQDWGRFFAGAADDPLLAEGAAVAADLAERHELVWLTGRPAWLREVTAGWLTRHDLPAGTLRMRPGRDHRPARVFKLDELRDLRRTGTVAAVLDDDPEVVAAALADGFPAVLADWVPWTRGEGGGRDRRTLRQAQERSGRT